MKNMMILSIFCLFLLVHSTVSVIGTIMPKRGASENDLVGKFLNFTDKNEVPGNYTVYTIGPVLNLFTSVELIDGVESQIDLIDKNINRRFPRISMLLPYIFVIADNLDFTFEYLMDVKNNSRFSYGTTWGEVVYDDNGNFVNITNESLVINKVHKMQVSNFTGVFIFMRMRLRKIPFIPNTNNWLIPARFAFIGFCENVKEIDS